MRPEDWERAEEWFHRLAPLDVAERSERLEEISASDPDLAGDVRSLLSSHDSEGLLDRLTAKLAPEGPGAGLSVAPLTGASITHYEVGKLVGRGGMGDVYRARDTRLDREVALKFLPAWLGRDPTARDRFLVEARIVSSIDHPNVCTLFDIGETDDGRLFLVMPYYEGDTLKLRLKKGPLSDVEALDVALQVARGLAAAHERGIVHRDVKPGNLLLADDGRVKILDFGVAKLADVSLTRPGETPGTATYMAPEQSAGGSVDARADLWALGAVMYEMLTGARPAGPIEPESDGSGATAEGLTGMPRGLAETVARLLAARPDERYPDARTLIEDLEILAGGAGSLSPHPAPSLQRFLAELKRRHVFRVAAVYGVAGFAVIEVADVIFPRIPLPEWTVSLVVWLVLLGFPIALVLAWAFEMAPGGVRRTRSIRPAILDAIVAQPATRRWPIGIAGLVGGLLLATGAWLTLEGLLPTMTGHGGESPGAAVTAAGLPVAVLPFRTVNTGEDTAVWHEGIVHLLSSSIESVDGLRKIDPTGVMSAWAARFGDKLVSPNTTDALDVARRLGARYAISGSALATSGAGSIRLTGEGFDLETGRSTGSASVEAPADSVYLLVDRLAVALLRDGVLPAGDVQPAGLSQVTTTSFPAFREYLKGEQDFRRGRYEEAAISFVRAADLDTTFARAMFRAGTSYFGMGEFGLGYEYVGRAAALAPRLPSRDSMLFATRRSALSDLERYTTLYPDDADGWVELGEGYWHHGGKSLRPADAYRQAWERALSLSTVYAEQYIHLIEDAFARRDSSHARELLDAYAALDPERHPCPEYEHAWADAWGSELDAARVRQELPSEETGSSNPCAWTTLAAGSAASVDEWERRDLSVLRPKAKDPNFRGQAVIWRTLQARLMRGELSRARQILDRVEGIPDLEEWAARFTIHWHLTDFPDSAAAEAARALLLAQPIVSGDPEHFDLMAGSHSSPFWLGVLAVAEDRPVDADAQAARLEAAVDTIASMTSPFPGQPYGPDILAAETGAMAEAIRHYARLSRAWDPDLTEFESTLERLRSIGFGKEEPEMFLRYWMGGQLLERGDLHNAERYFRTFTPFHWSHYVPAQFHLGRIYEELGEPERAREHYRIFVEWWETADPELQPWVDEGRTALERLAGRRGTDTRSGSQARASGLAAHPQVVGVHGLSLQLKVMEQLLFVLPEVPDHLAAVLEQGPFGATPRWSAPLAEQPFVVHLRQ